MAYFRLRTDAEKWFSNITNKDPFKTKFDLYYICAMAGLATGRAPDPQQAPSPASDIIDYFVEPYGPVGELIIGLLISAELRRRGIDVTERELVRALFKQLVDPKSGNDLSDEGVRHLNAYASGGYDYLSTERDLKPHSAEEFLESFALLIRKAAGDGKSAETPDGGEVH